VSLARDKSRLGYRLRPHFVAVEPVSVPKVLRIKGRSHALHQQVFGNRAVPEFSADWCCTRPGWTSPSGNTRGSIPVDRTLSCNLTGLPSTVVARRDPPRDRCPQLITRIWWSSVEPPPSKATSQLQDRVTVEQVSILECFQTGTSNLAGVQPTSLRIPNSTIPEDSVDEAHGFSLIRSKLWVLRPVRPRRKCGRRR